MRTKRVFGLVLVMFGLILTGAAAFGQAIISSDRPRTEIMIIPQARIMPMPVPGATVSVTGVDVRIAVDGQNATTMITVSLKNDSNRRLEAELMMPVPDGAVIRGFTFQGAGKEPTAQLLPKEEARRIYDEIVAKIRDPALLEFVGLNLVRSSVFPVEPNGTQKLQLTYEHLLPMTGDRVDFFLPRTESLDYAVPWTIRVTLKTKRPVSTVYSPTHELKVERKDDKNLVIELTESAQKATGPFRLSWLLQGNGVSATMYTYPDTKIGGGYFLLLAGLPAEKPAGAPEIKREVTLVLDRSGSMNGEKIEQVKEAARQIIAGLEKGESFNIIAYNETVTPLAQKPLKKDDDTVKAARAFLDDLTARGGTNIHDALLEALRQKPEQDTLPIVLFLTDGLPTVGQTSETTIRELAAKGNPYKKRVFTFGVGVDVNTPLLEKIALGSRAKATFVLPKEDVEVKVAQVYAGLSGPVLAEPVLAVKREKNDAQQAQPHVQDVLPAELPDLFEGDQLILLGQYKGEDPLIFNVSGNYRGKPRVFSFTFSLEDATTANSFVPRLWASRKIGMLIDAIRQLGADSTVGPNDPRAKELIDEIVRLSTEFGILTEYTAFLAREGTDLSNPQALRMEAGASLESRAMKVRSGYGSVNQSVNNEFYRNQSRLNADNRFLDESMQLVSVTNIQQVNDRAFFRRGNVWVDSRLVQQDGDAKADRVVQVGSVEFNELVDKLAAENRQGVLSLKGEMMIQVDAENVLVQ